MRSGLFLSMLGVLACGTSTGDTPAGGGTFESSSTTDTPPTGGVPEACEIYRGDALGPPVTLTVTNGTDVPVWVGAAGCVGAPRFQLRDATGKDPTDRFDVAYPCASYTCEDYLEQDDCTLQDPECVCPPVIANYLLPGKSITTEWPGGHVELLDFNPQCAVGAGCTSLCSHPEKAPAGAYTLSIEAFETCTVNCDCQPNGDGWCQVSGDATTYVGAPLLAEVDFDYPGDSAVQLTIVRP
jgi:hypothetical protein